ncbi:MAG: hypothetical protein OXU51_11045, partial [Candidatus Poribacteria bacterium]|nr:hypothetical protein [Candidatus Poribacteria bacterium]
MVISDSRICLILILCCFFSQSVVGANAPAETSEDTQAETLLLTAAPDPTRIDKIEYYIDTAPIAETTAEYNMLSKQVAVRVEDRLSPYAIQQSIKKLYATQQYSQIQVYVQKDINGVALTYQLTSFDRIKAVVVAGIPPNQFRSAIENGIKSKPSGRYVPAIANTDITYIKRICTEYGYFDAQVTVSDTLTEEGVLTYQIRVGDPSRIKRLQIQNNFAISNDRLIAV